MAGEIWEKMKKLIIVSILGLIISSGCSWTSLQKQQALSASFDIATVVGGFMLDYRKYGGNSEAFDIALDDLMRVSDTNTHDTATKGYTTISMAMSRVRLTINYPGGNK